MALALLNDWNEEVQGQGVVKFDGSEGIPGIWKLSAAYCDPKAFPTPLARAEAMRHALSCINDENRSSEVLTEQFRLLALGVALGHLELRPVDLNNNDKFGNLGAAVSRVEPDARYMVFLVLKTAADEVCYGATHPDCLFWPHARRTKADWDRLASLVGPEAQKAIKVWAGFRQALIAGEAWDLDKIEWQAGINAITKEVASPEDCTAALANLRQNTRFVGPVVTRVKVGSGEDELGKRLVYIPVFHEGFARQFIDYLHLGPPAKADNGIELRDPIGVAFARIRLQEKRQTTDMLAMGNGITEFLDGGVPRNPAEKRLWVRGQDDKEGLIDLLQELETDLSKSEFRWGRSQSLAKRCPVAFPDPIRILAAMGLWQGDDASGPVITFSEQCNKAATGARGLGRLPEPEDVNEGGGLIVTTSTLSGPLRIAYVDTLGELAVNDLRALGLALFRVFTGEGFEMVDGEAQWSGDSPFVRTEQRPLDAVEELYGQAGEPGNGKELGKRLATLQRFLASYQQPRDETEGELGNLLGEAVKAMCNWAMDGREVKPLGKPGLVDVQLKLPGDQTVTLARDWYSQ